MSNRNAAADLTLTPLPNSTPRWTYWNILAAWAQICREIRLRGRLNAIAGGLETRDFNASGERQQDDNLTVIGDDSVEANFDAK